MIVGLSLGNSLGFGTVSRNEETSRNDWTAIGAWRICRLVLSSELDSACCFPLSLLVSGSDAESDPLCSFSDQDEGSLSPSWSWMLSLGSLRYGFPVGLSCNNSNHYPW